MRRAKASTCNTSIITLSHEKQKVFAHLYGHLRSRGALKGIPKAKRSQLDDDTVTTGVLCACLSGRHALLEFLHRSLRASTPSVGALIVRSDMRLDQRLHIELFGLQEGTDDCNGKLIR